MYNVFFFFFYSVSCIIHGSSSLLEEVFHQSPAKLAAAAASCPSAPGCVSCHRKLHLQQPATSRYPELLVQVLFFLPFLFLERQLLPQYRKLGLRTAQLLPKAFCSSRRTVEFLREVSI
jgi:hypothetical protein